MRPVPLLLSVLTLAPSLNAAEDHGPASDPSYQQALKNGYPFEVLSDLDDRVIKTYGLYFEVPADLSAVYRQRLALDLADYNGAGRYGLPVPATFIVDRNGIIRAAFADTDYRKRMEPAAILDALVGLPTP